ncbi:MAG: HAMP domain-containing histidine kinase [Candidatus Eremiobacteraeota bacterium]|nr:HAMP domain-containing histidine kinase [Candidatus Eremiobacteraeota bacterium]
MTFRSLRWRIASFYIALLIGVIIVVAAVLAVQLRSLLLDEARAKITRVGGDIAQLVRGDSALSAIGDTAPIAQELTATGALDHWAGPTTFVEIDTPQGYPIAKSTNMGGASFAPTIPTQRDPVVYSTENRPPLGSLLVRSELVTYPGSALIVAVGESLEVYDDTLLRIRDLLLAVIVVALLVVVAGSFAIAKSALDPIKRLSAAMGEIRSDRLSRRLGWSRRRDELGTLAAAFDAMLDRLEEGFARERQFISDASHELKTPLTVINANAQMLERWAARDPAVRDDSIAAIRDESAALANMVNGMLLLAKAESGEDIPRERVALEGIVAEAIGATRGRANDKGLELAYQPSPSATRAAVLGDAGLLRQLVTNLIDNAIKFTKRGRIDVTVEVESGEARAVIAVADTGSGIDEQSLGRIFDRFYRTDASRNRAIPGTGLGLEIVRSIARVHGGTVTAARRPGGGSEFRVSLPMLTTFQ